MIQVVNSLQMLLVRQYFDDWLVPVKQQICSFSRTEKKSNHSKHTKGFWITRDSNIFRIKPDIYILAEKFFQHNFEGNF